MRNPVAASIYEKFAALSPRDRDILLLLALVGPRGISALTELVSAAGLRETPTRAYSTTYLRKVLAPLTDAGLVFSSNLGFDCSAHARELALRDGAMRGVMNTLINIRAEAHPDLRYTYGRNPAAWFDFRVAIHRRDLDAASKAHEQCAELDPVRFVAQHPLVQAVCGPFDAQWMSGFGTNQGVVAAWTLDYANRFALDSGDLVPWVHEHVAELEQHAPLIRELLVEAALMRANFDIVRAQLDAPTFGTSAPGVAYGAVLAMLSGDTAAALAGFERAELSFSQAHAKKKASPPLPRLCALFYGLALVHRGAGDDLAHAARLANNRQRDKSYEYREAAALLKAIAEASAMPRNAEDARHVAEPAAYNDCIAALLRGLFALWFPVDPFERLTAAEACVDRYRASTAAGYGWLANEYLCVAHALNDALRKSLPDKGILARELADLSVPPIPKQSTTEGPRNAGVQTVSLVNLYVPKPPWQLALNALEQLTSKPSTPSSAPESAQERIVWRVSHAGHIEPYLQKRTPKGWTGGRKVAVKQLLAGGDQHALLSAHDARVAAHIREDVSTNYAGYVNREYYVHSHALLDLVGHPLVFIEPDWDTPAQLVKGDVRLRANVTGNTVVIQMEPPGLSKEPRLVPDATRWLVYCLDKQQDAIAEIVGNGLHVPATARQQTLDLLGKLASFVVVESSDQVTTQQVTADSTLWLQMVPNGTGLNVTASVRPLGEKGPQLRVGEGVPTLIGSVDGVPVQAERDLAEERKRLSRLLKQCTALQQSEIEPGHFSLQEPESCLELLSLLREVGDGVEVQWPHGKALTLRAKLGKRALRGWLRHEAGWFFAGGTLDVDSELSVELKQLVELLADGSRRFVRLESGEYLELETELREMVDALRSASTKAGARSEIAIPMGALGSLDMLTQPQSGWKLDQSTSEWRTRFEAAFSKPIPIPKGLHGELRDYQVEGFRWLARLAELELGACLADDMGLGKTIEIIALLLRRAQLGVALIVAPTSVCNNWRVELERFAPTLRARIYVGAGRSAELQALQKRDVVITSYALLQQDSETLQNVEWTTVVLDEGQFIKNSETQRAKAAYALRASMRIIATGTPIENSPGDLRSLFQFLNPQLFGSAQLFQRRFGRAAEGDDPTATRQRKELRRLIKPFVLRRTKAQVLEDLPPLTEIRHAVELSPGEAHLYEALRQRALAKLEQLGEGAQTRIQILAELTRLRRLCCHPALVSPEANLGSSKLTAFMELVEELLENRHRALVFSQFVDFLALARKLLDGRKVQYQYLDGSTPAKQRATSVDAFQSGEGDLFLISLKAGGFGLNLTGADYVIHLDPWWNPAAEQQATDRAHRIGQERPVTVYRLVTAGTIEERIVELHHRKRELADTLLEGAESAARISESELLELLT